MDVIRALLGSGAGGAASLDGLAAMRSRQMSSALKRHPAGPDDSQIDSGVEAFLYNAGLLPHSGLGQSATALFRGLYGLAPEHVGSLIGRPDPSRLFGYYANGASGMDVAAGHGMTDILNPYSVLESHRRAMDLGQMTYGLATRKDGGYDIGFGHGLNMDEIGLVGQRLLSSGLPYRKYWKSSRGEMDLSAELGERVDPEANPDEFRDNLKQLGSKFNEAASMLSKVTGSVKEALRFMDEIAGGNFLGGTAKEATDVANRAKEVATAYRVTAALSGEDPKAMFASSRNLASTMAAGMGVDPKLAKVSGFEGAMMDMSSNAMLTYGFWAAAHPNASRQEKQAAMSVASARTVAYSNSDASALMASVTKHADSFTGDELDEIRQAAEEGDLKRVYKFVERRIGLETLRYEMSSAGRVVTRMDATRFNREMLAGNDAAAIQGNVVEAGKAGRNRYTDMVLADTVGGDEAMEKAVREGGANALRAKLEERGFTRESLAGKDVDELLRLARRNMNPMEAGDVYRQGQLAAAKSQIEANTLSETDEARIRNEYAELVRSDTSLNANAREMLLDEIGSNPDMDKVTADLGKWLDTDKVDKIRGKGFTQGDAYRRMESIRKAQEDYRESTGEERIAALGEREKRNAVARQGRYLGLLDGVNYISGEEALQSFAANAQAAAEKGDVSLGDGGKDLQAIYRKGAERMLARVFGNELGDLKGKDLQPVIGDFAAEMVSGIRSGRYKDARDAFSAISRSLAEGEGAKARFGEKGVETLAKWGNGEAMPKEQDLGMKALLSYSANIIGGHTEQARTGLIGELKDLYEGKFDRQGMSDDDVLKRFSSTLGRMVGADPEEVMGNAKGENLKDWMDSLLKRYVPGRVHGYANAAMGAGDNVAKAMVALMDGRMSLDFIGNDIGLDRWTSSLSALDATRSDAEMNRVTNAIANGDIAQYRKTVAEGTAAQIAKLQETLDGKGISRKEVEEAFRGNDRDSYAKQEELRKNLGDEGFSMLKAVSGTKDIGGEGGYEFLFSKEARERAKNGKSYADSLYGVAKEANRQDNLVYSGISELVRILKTSRISVNIDNDSPIRVREEQ